MELTRSELLPGVFLTHLRSDKFKTACMSVNLLTQLRRETAAMNALIPAAVSILPNLLLHLPMIYSILS